MLSAQKFPTVFWQEKVATFSTDTSLVGIGEYPAVVVFALFGDRFVIANIPGRGWCTPSGRPEMGESPIETAIRETWEEVGARIADLQMIGRYSWGMPGETPDIVPTFVGRVEEFGNLPNGTESLGAQAAALEDLPQIYWLWDDLIESVFRYSLAAIGL